MKAALPPVARARASLRRSHPGEPHEWGTPVPQLAGARVCRSCGQLYPGSPASPGPSPAVKAPDGEARLVAEPYRACPRFETCSVNACPLDPEIGVRAVDPGDREVKCPLGKRARRSVFASLPPAARARLPYGGLFETEAKRRANLLRRLESMPPAERERIRQARDKGLADLKRARLNGLTAPPDEKTGSHASQPTAPPKERTEGEVSA